MIDKNKWKKRYALFGDIFIAVIMLFGLAGAIVTREWYTIPLTLIGSAVFVLFWHKVLLRIVFGK